MSNISKKERKQIKSYKKYINQIKRMEQDETTKFTKMNVIDDYQFQKMLEEPGFLHSDECILLIKELVKEGMKRLWEE